MMVNELSSVLHRALRYRSRTSALLICSMLCGACLWSSASEAARGSRADRFSFAVVGDDPYFESDIEKFSSLFESLKSANLAFGVHVGDFKHDDHRGCITAGKPAETEIDCLKSGDPRLRDRILGCSIDNYERMRSLITDTSPDLTARFPFVLLFGDNDWLECPSSNRLDARQTEREAATRLDELRRIFISDGGEYAETIRTKLSPARQMQPESNHRYCPGSTDVKPHPEHMRWEHGGVVFATLTVVGYGGDNKFLGNILDDYRGKNANDEFSHRECAYKQWLDETFLEAKTTDARGLVIFMHGSPLFEKTPCDSDRYGFNGFINVLAWNMEQFPRPVLVIHGDDHNARLRESPPFFYEPRPPASGVVREEVLPCRSQAEQSQAQDAQKPFRPVIDRRFPNLVEITTFGASPDEAWNPREIPWIQVTVNPEQDAYLFSVEFKLPKARNN